MEIKRKFGILKLGAAFSSPWLCIFCSSQQLYMIVGFSEETSSQAPSYARRLQPKTMTHWLTDSLTGVKCRATSVAKKQVADCPTDFWLCYLIFVFFSCQNASFTCIFPMAITYLHTSHVCWCTCEGTSHAYCLACLGFQKTSQDIVFSPLVSTELMRRKVSKQRTTKK